LEVVVNDNLSWRMLLIVSPDLTFWTALPRVTIIATSLVVLLQFLLRTRRAHISRKRKGSPLIRMNPSPKIMQFVPNRNTSPRYSPSLPCPSHMISTLGSVEVLVLLGSTHARTSHISWWVMVVGVP